jgi:uncharacterized protein YjbJ (UPF0337 family)
MKLLHVSGLAKASLGGGNAMEWKRMEGNWKRFRSNVKDKWGKLTDDDLAVINGRRDRLEGKIQQRYGFATEHVSKEVDDWFRWQDLKVLGPRTKRSAQDPSRGPLDGREVLTTKHSERG